MGGLCGVCPRRACLPFVRAPGVDLGLVSPCLGLVVGCVLSSCHERTLSQCVCVGVACVTDAPPRCVINVLILLCITHHYALACTFALRGGSLVECCAGGESVSRCGPPKPGRGEPPVEPLTRAPPEARPRPRVSVPSEGEGVGQPWLWLRDPGTVSQPWPRLGPLFESTRCFSAQAESTT